MDLTLPQRLQQSVQGSFHKTALLQKRVRELVGDLGSTGGNPQPAIELPVAVECQTVHTGGRTIRFGAGNSRFVISGVRIGRLCAYDIFRAIGLSTRPDFPAQFSPAVIAMPDERWGERPLAVVVPRGDTPPTSDELLAMLAEQFPKWWLPEQIVVRKEIPKTSAGKFLKSALREQYTARV